MKGDTPLPLPTVRVGDVTEPSEQTRWLVRSLWPAAAVGIVGGSPKSCKTWFALDLALSVASATPCLGTFPVEQPGPVLAFLAEDSIERIRARIAAMARHRNRPLQGIDLHLIREGVLRLDRERDLLRLRATIQKLQPRLLLLDPFVRLHRINENDAGEVSRILGDLRQLQRDHQLAVLLVHHARKNGPRAGGAALRGSSDLFAWGDTYVSLQRNKDTLRLDLEHRDERPIEPLALRLSADNATDDCRLEVVQQDSAPDGSEQLQDAVLAALQTAGRPMTRTALREQLRINNQRLGDALDALLARRALMRASDGWTPSPAFRSDS